MDKIQQLTFSRFVAAFAIVVYHFGQRTSLYQLPILQTLFENANIAVSFFYVLSGFVLYYTYSKKESVSWFTFVIKRLRRIYPAYLAALLLTLLIKSFLWGDVVLSLLMLQTWVPGKSLILNNPGWSISNEFFFYACFPLLFPFFKKIKQLPIQSLVVVLFWIISQVFYLTFNSIDSKYFLYQPLLHFNSFVLGMLAASFFLKKTPCVSNITFIWKVILGLIFIICLFLFDNKSIHNGLLSPVFALLIYVMAMGSDVMTRFFSRPIFQFLGEISYSLYIFQFPVWIGVSEYRMSKYLNLSKTIDEELKFTIRFLILLLVSIVFYYVIEKPIQQYFKNKNNH